MLKRRLFLLFILAFGINLAILRWMYMTSEHIPEIDGIVNLIEAKSLAEGYGKEANNNPFWPYVVSWVYRFARGVPGLQDIELVGRLVSVLCGSLLGLPIFFLARSLYGERVAFLSATLAIFYPNLQRFNQAPAETSAFPFFLTLGFYVGWAALGDNRHLLHGEMETPGRDAGKPSRGPRYRYTALLQVGTGLLLGISYLIRPEALAYWPAFAVWILLSRPGAPTRAGFLEAPGAAFPPPSPSPGEGEASLQSSLLYEAGEGQKGSLSVCAPTRNPPRKELGSFQENQETREKGAWAHGARAMGLFLLGLGIAVTGYLFFLHHYYHRWTPIPKGIPRIIATEAAIPRTYEQLYYGLLDNKTLGEQAAQEGALHFLFTNLIHNPERLWSIYRANLNLLLHLVTPSFEVSRKILSPVLALLILTGFLLKGRWRRQDFKKELYLLTFFAPLPGQLLYMIDERVCIYLLPALILWGGRGIGVLAGRFGEMLASRLPPQKAKSWARVFLFSFVGFIVSVFIIKSPLIALAKSPMASLIVPPSPEERFSRWQRSGFEEPLELKEVGKWLRKHGKPNPRIMERKAIVAFYAGGTNVALPYAEYPEILKYAKRVRADYLIADERFVGNLRPSLKFLLDEKNSPAELKLVAEYSFPKVLVYEFRNP